MLTRGRRQTAAQQQDSPDFGVAARQQHRLVDTAAGAGSGNARAIDAGLRRQPGKRRIKIARPLFGGLLPLLGGVVALSLALTVSAIIQRQDMVAAGRCTRRQSLPRRSVAVARVEQEHGRSGPARRE